MAWDSFQGRSADTEWRKRYLWSAGPIAIAVMGTSGLKLGLEHTGRSLGSRERYRHAREEKAQNELWNRKPSLNYFRINDYVSLLLSEFDQQGRAVVGRGELEA